MPENPCPIPSCPGQIHAVKLSGGLHAFGCDTGEHMDAAIRSALIRESGERYAESEERIRAIDRRLDPVAWIKDQVLRAQEAPELKFQRETLTGSKPLPTYATGFTGRSGHLIALRGMVTLSGRASSGKSWFALGSALQSAAQGWWTHYLAAEGEDVIRRRVERVYGDSPPDRFALHSVKPRVTTEHMIREIAEWIESDRTLVVIDSISTLMGLMVVDPRASRWDEQSRLEVFLMRLRELTRGEVAILILSESNAAGETKGRTLDHKSDVSINFQSVPDSDAKEIRVVKAWEGNTGLVGRARVDPSGPGLDLLDDGPVAYQDDHGYTETGEF